VKKKTKQALQRWVLYLLIFILVASSALLFLPLGQTTQTQPPQVPVGQPAAPAQNQVQDPAGQPLQQPAAAPQQAAPGQPGQVP
jgi:hypothetical protein